MRGNVQNEWVHEIPKKMNVKEGRLSLTFRRIINPYYQDKFGNIGSLSTLKQK